jgi:hypothetical protein
MHPRKEISPEVEQLIRSPTFWAHIEAVTKLISGIIDRQRTAEAGGNFNISNVQTLWMGIRRHIEETASPEVLPIFLDIFDRKRMQQHSTLFIVAHSLDPRNAIAFPPSPQATNILIDFVFQYSQKPAEARSQLTQFCTGTGVFTRTNRAYDLIDDPIAFWTEMMLYSKPLAELALRVFNTPATSSPCERDFITGRPVHVGWRLNFGLQKANELYFVYVNRRLLAPGHKTSAMLFDEKTIVEQEDREFGVISQDENIASEEAGEEKTSGEVQSVDSLETETPATEARDVHHSLQVPAADAVEVKESHGAVGLAQSRYEDRETDAREVKREAMEEKVGSARAADERAIGSGEMGCDGEMDSDELDAAGVEDDTDTMGPEALAIGGMDSDGIVVGGLGSGGLEPADTGFLSVDGGNYVEGGHDSERDPRDVEMNAEAGKSREVAGESSGEKDANTVEDMVEDSLGSRTYAQVGLG